MRFPRPSKSVSSVKPPTNRSPKVLLSIESEWTRGDRNRGIKRQNRPLLKTNDRNVFDRAGLMSYPDESKSVHDRPGVRVG